MSIAQHATNSAEMRRGAVNRCFVCRSDHTRSNCRALVRRPITPWSSIFERSAFYFRALSGKSVFYSGTSFELGWLAQSQKLLPADSFITILAKPNCNFYLSCEHRTDYVCILFGAHPTLSWLDFCFFCLTFFVAISQSVVKYHVAFAETYCHTINNQNSGNFILRTGEAEQEQAKWRSNRNTSSGWSDFIEFCKTLSILVNSYTLP